MIQDIIAIDTHFHFNHGNRFDSDPDSKIYRATLPELVKINKAANVEKMLCSTFAAVISAEETEAENKYLFDLVQKTENLYQWVVIDPRIKNTFAQADEMLDNPKCVGIKLQPVSLGYRIAEYEEELFSFAQARKAIIELHPDVPPENYIPMVDKYPDVKFIMAHLSTESYAKAIGMAEYGNVYADTSGMASFNNWIIEYTVDKVGSKRILFGTDTYAPGFQRGRIEYALISEEDKANILANNAIRLFGF